jgi:quercetin dioxygenase-like cupin family protein
VQMQPDQAGPEHTVNREQVWVVLEGCVDATVDGRPERANAGDTLVLPADVVRRIATPTGLVAVVASAAAPVVTSRVQGTRPLPWAV